VRFATRQAAATFIGYIVRLVQTRADVNTVPALLPDRAQAKSRGAERHCWWPLSPEICGAGLPDIRCRLSYGCLVEFAFLLNVEPVELGFHERDPLLLRYLPALVRVHGEQQLLDVLDRHDMLVWLPRGRFLCEADSESGYKEQCDGEISSSHGLPPALNLSPLEHGKRERHALFYFMEQIEFIYGVNQIPW
jgi:hypothetical protein